MSKPVLYLMLGYPGAGKTTAAQIIHQLTGASHLWADHVRRERYQAPTYSHQENIELYTHLNELTAELLAADNSVIFDTNFNYYKDRQHLRSIAREHGARSIVVWVTTPKDIARVRATDGAHSQETRVLGDMPLEAFERISRNLQPPQQGEKYVKVDGTKITPEYIRRALGDYIS